MSPKLTASRSKISEERLMEHVYKMVQQYICICGWDGM